MSNSKDQVQKYSQDVDHIELQADGLVNGVALHEPLLDHPRVHEDLLGAVPHRSAKK
jgi:hypothetical protein